MFGMTCEVIAATFSLPHAGVIVSTSESRVNRRTFLYRSLATGLCIGVRAVGASSEQAVGSGHSDWAAQRRFVQTESGRIALLDRGRGPIALLLHGFPLCAYQWRDVIGQLQSVRRCIAPDFLGLGYSEPAQIADLGPARQVTMLIQLLDALGVPSVDIIANDSGTAVAQLLIARASTRIRSVLLTNGDTEPDCPPTALAPVIALAKSGRYANEWLAPWSVDGALARSATGLGGMCYSRPENPTDLALAQYLEPLVRTQVRKNLVNRYAIGLEANSLAGVARHLAAFEGPASILWGAADPIFRRDSPDYLQGVLGHVRNVRRLPRAKLFFPEEYPDEIVTEARQLWNLA